MDKHATHTTCMAEQQTEVSTHRKKTLCSWSHIRRRIHGWKRPHTLLVRASFLNPRCPRYPSRNSWGSNQLNVVHTGMYVVPVPQRIFHVPRRKEDGLSPWCGLRAESNGPQLPWSRTSNHYCWGKGRDAAEIGSKPAHPKRRDTTSLHRSISRNTLASLRGDHLYVSAAGASIVVKICFCTACCHEYDHTCVEWWTIHRVPFDILWATETRQVRVQANRFPRDRSVHMVAGEHECVRFSAEDNNRSSSV